MCSLIILGEKMQNIFSSIRRCFLGASSINYSPERSTVVVSSLGDDKNDSHVIDPNTFFAKKVLHILYRQTLGHREMSTTELKKTPYKNEAIEFIRARHFDNRNRTPTGDFTTNIWQKTEVREKNGCKKIRWELTTITVNGATPIRHSLSSYHCYQKDKKFRSLAQLHGFIYHEYRDDRINPKPENFIIYKTQAQLSEHLRTGECQDLCCILAFSIWKTVDQNRELYPFIKRIEIIGVGNNYDHVICAINRNPNFNVKDFDKWGHGCIVIDPLRFQIEENQTISSRHLLMSKEELEKCSNINDCIFKSEHLLEKMKTFTEEQPRLKVEKGRENTILFLSIDAEKKYIEDFPVIFEPYGE